MPEPGAARGWPRSRSTRRRSTCWPPVGVDRVVATEAGLAPIPDQLVTLTGPFELDGERTSVQGVAADAGLSAHFATTGATPPSRRPTSWPTWPCSTSTCPARNGAWWPSPREWQPDRVFLDTLRVGLAGNPVVEAVGLDTLFATVPDATDLGEPLVRRPGGRPRRQPHRAGRQDPIGPGPARRPRLGPRTDQRGVGRPRRAPPGGPVGRLRAPPGSETPTWPACARPSTTSWAASRCPRTGRSPSPPGGARSR